MRSTRRALVVLVTVLALVAGACGDSDDDTASSGGGDDSSATTAPAGPSGTTIKVPDDHPTIQDAVNAASPGDLVLIAPGVYNEAVDVETENLTIRGLDRNEVILDGEFELENGIRVLVDGVAVENMTARNYTVNGFFWTGVTGYRGSYLTAYRNGDYGIYAFDSVTGQFDNSYGSGSPDAGFYIGQCYPCDAVIVDSIAEYNGLGYSGTNSGGNLIIARSRFNNNRAGVVPNTGSYELCYPERETTVVGNLVYANNQVDTPAIGAAIDAMGNGIILPGGVNNTVERNLVFDHDIAGISLVPYPEQGANDLPPSEDRWDVPCSDDRNEPVTTDPIPEEIYWPPIGNRIVGNTVSDSRVADIGILNVGEDVSTLRNCFSDNTVEKTAPTELQALAPCDGEGVAGNWVDDAVGKMLEALFADKPESVDYKDAPTPEPPAQPTMPDADTAPARPAIDVPMEIDVESITLPERPAGL
jgi:hypothetical protein